MAEEHTPDARSHPARERPRREGNLRDLMLASVGGISFYDAGEPDRVPVSFAPFTGTVLRLAQSPEGSFWPEASPTDRWSLGLFATGPGLTAIQRGSQRAQVGSHLT